MEPLEKRNKILLESGTNEIEIMIFTIDGELYGINVAKVKEIMMADTVKPMPHVHPAIEGIFKPRGVLMTVVDLPFYLTGSSGKGGKDLFIVTNFNSMHIAFRVNTVEEISRISWADIQKPDKTINGGEDGVATGITQCEGRLVTILDFEKITSDIAPETGIQLSELEKLGERTKREAKVLIAEDSVLLLKMIEAALNKAGYLELIKFNNGQEAWDYLEDISRDESFVSRLDLIITDIEMPQMDGHRLTKLIKSNPVLKGIPVVIFSSLIDEDMRRKGKEVGADEQLSKPEIGSLVHVIDALLEKRGKT